MNFWKRVLGVVTPGGDTCWECPACGKGCHVMGIETQYNFTNVCEDCGAVVFYSFQKICNNCVSYNKENGCCAKSGDEVKNCIACEFYEKG